MVLKGDNPCKAVSSVLTVSVEEYHEVREERLQDHAR